MNTRPWKDCSKYLNSWSFWNLQEGLAISPISGTKASAFPPSESWPSIRLVLRLNSTQPWPLTLLMMLQKISLIASTLTTMIRRPFKPINFADLDNSALKCPRAYRNTRGRKKTISFVEKRTITSWSALNDRWWGVPPGSLKKKKASMSTQKTT